MTDSVGIVDAATGRVLVDLTGWRLVGGTGGDHLLVTKAVDAGARTMVAVAGPVAGTRVARPRPLADLPAGTGDCQAVPNRLVCRSASGELMVWAYRKKVRQGLDVPVIELDLDAPPASAPSRAPAPLLPLGLALAAVLTLALGGAAPAESVRWQQVGVVRPAGPDDPFVLAGDRLYTVAAGPDGRRITTTARSAGTLDELWSTGTDQPESPGSVPGRATLSVVDGGLLLTGSTYATAMIDAGTGTVRWTESVPVLAVGAGLGVRHQTHFRPGTEYDRASGAPGELFWSSTGQPHTEPPRRTTVLGIDLASGRRLWADDERGSVRTVPVPGDAGQVVVAASDQLILRAARTGEVLRRAELPPAAAPRRSGPPAG